MGRKAISGYPEKSYYDNTVFNGVVATHDPLNEGSFALLSNYDIVDSGRSMVPRKGYTSTTFTVNDTPVVLSNKVLIFRDPNIQKDVVIDFNKLNIDATDKFAYLIDITQYNMINNLLKNASLISTYDSTSFVAYMIKRVPAISSVTNPLAWIFMHSTFLNNGQLKPIRDQDGVIFYITKLNYNNAGTSINYWIKFLYREKETVVGGVTYTADTLVIDAVDTTTQVTNFSNRNIASNLSIIPNPLRTKEAVGVIDTKPSEVNRPILVKTDGKHALTKLSSTYKDSLNVQIVPTFHLQDPLRIVGGTNAKWAYRFDFIRAAENTSTTLSNTVRYKTPWRTLQYTGDGENIKIDQLDTGDMHNNDLIYTYYVTSRRTHSWYEFLSATTYVTYEQVEAALYEKMRTNAIAGSSGTALSTLAFAYTKHSSLVNTLKPASIRLSDIDHGIYDQMAFHFLSEDDVRASVIAMGETLEALDARTAALSVSDVSALYTNLSYSATTNSVSSPILPMTYAQYNNIKKMTLDEFILHATEKQKTRKIRVVFMPFVYRHAGTVSSVPVDNVYICSLGGVYVNGLKNNLTGELNDVANFSDVVGISKEFTFTPRVVEQYVDCFKNFDKLYINRPDNTRDKSEALYYVPRATFEQGIFLVLYLKPYNDAMLAECLDKTTEEIRLINSSWDESAYKQASTVVWAEERDVVYLDEIDEENPAVIEDATKYVIFEDRLVVWASNKVYISEEGNYYDFKMNLKKVFPEEVLKVITFKTILLVFTVQNLYAIYRTEIDTFTGTYTTQGTPEFVKEVVWLQQPVLYNINPERKYLDVIQVYNQMILFYSNEGQLYMIKPSTMIDSETQFGIQYFNKSINNILSNYQDYINERLKLYGKLDYENASDYVIKEQIEVHALIDIDLIKIFYTVPETPEKPGRMTFVVIYDVVNNRYTTYDTLSFSKINHVRHIEGGELYITEHGSNTYFTLPVIGLNNVDQNVDMHYARMFKKEPIFTFIDSGNLNLNNHLRKRLRDLRIVLKNLDSTKILYNAELVLDDTIIRPFYGPDFKVKMMNGPDSSMIVDKVPVEDLNELFGMDQTIGVEGARDDITSYYLHHDADFYNQNSLLRTETLNSSRLLEYNSSILGVGKVIRIKIQFISKGKYKLQSFGIVYKERRI